MCPVCRVLQVCVLIVFKDLSSISFIIMHVFIFFSFIIICNITLYDHWYCLLLFCPLVGSLEKGCSFPLPMRDVPCLSCVTVWKRVWKKGIDAVRSSPRLLCVVSQLAIQRLLTLM